MILLIAQEQPNSEPCKTVSASKIGLNRQAFEGGTVCVSRASADNKPCNAKALYNNNQTHNDE